jgi:hypothetical protein
MCVVCKLLLDNTVNVTMRCWRLHVEMKPWDHTHGYHSILGNMRVSGVTLANFEGAAACASSPASGAFALSNHPHAPDAFHPHFFKNVS